MEETQKVTLSYSKELQDIALNTLSVRITEQLYDPVGALMVKQFAEKTQSGINSVSHNCNTEAQPKRPIILQEIPDYLPKIEEPKKAVLTLIPPTCKL